MKDETRNGIRLYRNYKRYILALRLVLSDAGTPQFPLVNNKYNKRASDNRNV
jgi:hypothetical protein